jgi:hypothetical protein
MRWKGCKQLAGMPPDACHLHSQGSSPARCSASQTAASEGTCLKGSRLERMVPATGGGDDVPTTE